MTDNLVEKLEIVPGITHTKTPFSDEWAQSRPKESSEKSLKDYLAKVSEPLFASRASLNNNSTHSQATSLPSTMDIMAWMTFESCIVRSLAKSPTQALGKEIDGGGTLPLID